MYFRGVLLAALLCLVVAPAVRAMPEADAAKLLKGKVEEHDKVVRLQRPKTPKLDIATGAAADAAARLHSLVQFGDGDFSKQLVSEPPVEDELLPGQPESTHLTSEADSKELVIAWEQWHKRVCGAIYKLWLQNSKIMGQAHTVINVTRDRHITVTVTSVEIAPAELALVPGGWAFAQPKMEEEYAREVTASVEPLNGSDILTFPEKSRRTETHFTPYFKKMGEAGYDWRKDDYERVPVN